MATLKQVAAEAGVSISTASAALRGLDLVAPQTAQKVTQAAEKLDYHVNVSARVLKQGKTGIFGLIVPDLETEFYSMLANALGSELAEEGKSLIIEFSGYDPDLEVSHLQSLSSSICDGLFVCSTGHTAQQIKEIVGNRCPVVLFDDMTSLSDACFDAIHTPNQEGMEALIAHLVEQGYRHIALVGAVPEEEQNNPRNLGSLLHSRRKTSAFQALADHDLQPAAVLPANWSTKGGLVAADSIAPTLLDKPGSIDAFCCMNDALALGLIRGLHTHGIHVPDDVAVGGFDGVNSSTLQIPSLTTVAIDFTGMARTAITLMNNRVRERNHSKQPILPQDVATGFHLRISESTASRAQEA